MNWNEIDRKQMQRAFQLAEKAAENNEVPVGAVIVHNNQIIGEGWNQPIIKHDPTAHAEIVAIREAAQQIQNYRLLESTLYVTLEPCAMCLAAMVHARVKRLVFACWDVRAGAVRSAFSLIDDEHFNHKIQWSEGVMHDECSKLLTDFFENKRG